MKKIDLFFLTTYTVIVILLCIYQYAFSPLCFLFIALPFLLYIIGSFVNRIHKISGKILKILSLILCPVLLALFFVFFNIRQITIGFNLYSFIPLFLLIISGFIMLTHSRFDPQHPETRTSYNVFESNLLDSEIKVMYQYANNFMSGFIVPMILTVFLFDDFIRELSVLLFFISVVGGLSYGRMLLNPLLKEKKLQQQKELEDEIRKEQGYR